MTSRIQNIVFEVERKFSKLRVYPLTINGGNPPFRSLTYQGRHCFRDVYYDKKNMLSSAGTWVRLRNGAWQSKIRQAGDYNNSQFHESQDVVEIARQVDRIINNRKQSVPFASSAENFGLSVMADFTTHRETWKANDRFKIVLDRTDFGHVVGEVELEESVPADVDTKIYGAEMDEDVVKFMQTYQWAFDTSPAIGKLTAYFNLKREEAT